MSICYGSMQEVSEPSLESPRPPMAVSRQGCREGSRKRLPSLHPCLLTAIPVCPPRGLPMRPSRTHGGRGRTLQRPHPPWPRHSRVGFLLWLDMCENNIIGRADNHYFREISFFAMARCSLLGSCYGSVRKRPVLLPQTAEGEAGARPQAAIHQPPLPLFGGQAVASPLPHPAAAEGAGWCSSAKRPFTSLPLPPPLPVQPPQGGFPFNVLFPYVSVLAACFLLWLGA